jgi:hypothetical protein
MMKRLQKAVRPGYIEVTLQAWEDMRSEVLHEIQDGGSVREEQIEAASDIAAHVFPWVLGEPQPARPSHAHRR